MAASRRDWNHVWKNTGAVTTLARKSQTSNAFRPNSPSRVGNLFGYLSISPKKPQPYLSPRGPSAHEGFKQQSKAVYFPAASLQIARPREVIRKKTSAIIIKQQSSRSQWGSNFSSPKVTDRLPAHFNNFRLHQSRQR